MRLSSNLWGALVASSLLLSLACEERFFNAATDPVLPDASTGGAGGTLDAGGGAGAGGNGGGGPSTDGPIAGVDARQMCVPMGVEVCNGNDDDCNDKVDDVDPAMLNDVLSCGSCDVVCTARPNTVAKCENKMCKYECQPGAVNVDQGLDNGCECLLTNNGTEVCDTRDNNCDGKVDEGFDLKGDIMNCGACNRRCVYAFAKPLCTDGTCRMGECLPGFYDRDRDPSNGCEFACAKTNGGVETCDGVDNDCDGMVDNNLMAPANTCKSQGACAGAKVECKGNAGWACTYGAAYQPSEDLSQGCDGVDNDCDGRTDEAFSVDAPCSVGVGGCAATGVLQCDPTDPMKMKTRCTAMPKAGAMEICNGVDDDCDGQVDELKSMADRTADDKLVYLAGPNVTMFAYEASRIDANATGPGVDTGGRPCAVASRHPWSNVTQEEARKACAAIGTGWRLCTKDEWFAACRGAAGTIFPYGTTYAGDKCNGWDFVSAMDRDVKGVTTVASGSAAQCVSDQSGGAGDELFDMSGNLKEWVLTSAPNASTLTYELRGGAYNALSFGSPPIAPGLQCDASLPAPPDTAVRLPSVGFRCCLEGKLP